MNPASTGAPVSSVTSSTSRLDSAVATESSSPPPKNSQAMSPATAATTTIAAMIGTGFLYHGVGGSPPSGSSKPVPGGVAGRHDAGIARRPASAWSPRGRPARVRRGAGIGSGSDSGVISGSVGAPSVGWGVPNGGVGVPGGAMSALPGWAA